MDLMVSNMFLCLLRQKLKFSFTGNGLIVHPTDNSGQKLPPIRHRLLLSGMYADSPARMKVANTMASAAAYLACQWCWFAGTKARASEETLDTGRAMLFRGYATQALVKVGPLQGEHIQLHHADHDKAERLLTSQDMWDRAEFVESQKKPSTGKVSAKVAKVSGCLGLCPIMKALPYTDYVNFFILPFGHAVFLGVVKDCVKLILGQLPEDGSLYKDMLVANRGARRAINAQEGSFVLTSDFGRPYTSVIDRSGTYVMEDWSRFLEVYSVYLFSSDVHGREVLPQLAKKAWGHLRRFVLYHMRSAGRTEDPTAPRKALEELLEFAKIMDVVSVYLLRLV